MRPSERGRLKPAGEGGAYGPYWSSASKSASRAARDQEGEPALRAWVEAAAEEGDLLHPMGWPRWASASVESFELAASALSETELEKLNRAVDAEGGNWVAVFAASPEKARALMARGLDPRAKSCVKGGARMEAGALCCLNYWIAQLAGMMRAGVAPPERFEGALEGRGLIGRVTPLQALMTWGSGRERWRDELAGVMEWLCSGGLSVREADEAGDDALKTAISRGAAFEAGVLLDLGARPEDKNAAGQSAFDVLDQRIERARKALHQDEGMEALVARMAEERARAEGRLIEAAMGSAPAAANRAPRV